MAKNSLRLDTGSPKTPTPAGAADATPKKKAAKTDGSPQEFGTRDGSEIEPASKEERSAAQQKVHIRRVLGTPIKDVLTQAKSKVAGTGQLEPEHVAIYLLEQSGIEIEAADRKTIMDSARRFSGDADAKGMSDRLVEAMVTASVNAGDDAELTPALLLEVISEGREDYSSLLSQIQTNARLNALDGDTNIGETSEVDERSFADLPDFFSGLGTDMVVEAAKGGYDRAVGRAAKVQETYHVLGKRKLNNPVITGERGVGKTAIVKGIANDIAFGRAPEEWKDARIISTSPAAILKAAGRDVDGYLKELATQIANAAKDDPGPPMKIILFVDEIHTIMEGEAAQANLANYLKTHLDEGKISIIGATTDDEYKGSIRKDGALKDRLPQVSLDAPVGDEAVQMAMANLDRVGNFHGVEMEASAAQASVDLAHFVSDDMVHPRASTDLLDSVASMVKQQLNSMPAKLRQVQKEVRDVRTALSQATLGEDDDSMKARSKLSDRLEELTEEFEDLSAQADKERAILDTLQTKGTELVDLLKDEKSKPKEVKALQKEIEGLHADLKELPERLFHLVVDNRAVAQFVADKSGTPVSKLQAQEDPDYADIVGTLGKKVFGQAHLHEPIAEALILDRTKLRDPNAPIGVFLMAGLTGTGKTETARVTADEYFGGNLIEFSCNEMQKSHELAKVFGAPPGYVGFEGGSRLAEEVRKAGGRAVILLDEIEKAHFDIWTLFMQIFDRGIMRDNEGKEVDMRNCMFMLTSNLASKVMAEHAGDGEYTDMAAVKAGLVEAMNTFPNSEGIGKPEVLGRISNINASPNGTVDLSSAIANPLGAEVMAFILSKVFGDFVDRVEDQQNRNLGYTPEAQKALAKACFTPSQGGRGLKKQLKTLVEKPFAQALLANEFAEGSFITVDLDPNDNKAFVFREMTDEERRSHVNTRKDRKAKAPPKEVAVEPKTTPSASASASVD